MTKKEIIKDTIAYYNKDGYTRDLVGQLKILVEYYNLDKQQINVL